MAREPALKDVPEAAMTEAEELLPPDAPASAASDVERLLGFAIGFVEDQMKAATGIRNAATDSYSDAARQLASAVYTEAESYADTHHIVPANQPVLAVQDALSLSTELTSFWDTWLLAA